MMTQTIKEDSRSVKETDSVCWREAGRKLMRVHLDTRAAIKVDDFQSNTRRLEQDVSQSLHSRVVNLDLVRVDVGIAVASHGMRKHKRSVVFGTSFHPSRGESLIESVYGRAIWVFHSLP